VDGSGSGLSKIPSSLPTTRFICDHSKALTLNPTRRLACFESRRYLHPVNASIVLAKMSAAPTAPSAGNRKSEPVTTANRHEAIITAITCDRFF